MNLAAYFKPLVYVRFILLAGTLFLGACSYSFLGTEPNFLIESSICPSASQAVFRTCVTAVFQAQWVDAYTLAQLR